MHSFVGCRLYKRSRWLSVSDLDEFLCRFASADCRQLKSWSTPGDHSIRIQKAPKSSSGAQGLRLYYSLRPKIYTNPRHLFWNEGNTTMPQTDRKHPNCHKTDKSLCNCTNLNNHYRQAAAKYHIHEVVFTRSHFERHTYLIHSLAVAHLLGNFFLWEQNWSSETHMFAFLSHRSLTSSPQCNFLLFLKGSDGARSTWISVVDAVCCTSTVVLSTDVSLLVSLKSLATLVFLSVLPLDFPLYFCFSFICNRFLCNSYNMTDQII